MAIYNTGKYFSPIDSRIFHEVKSYLHLSFEFKANKPMSAFYPNALLCKM